MKAIVMDASTVITLATNCLFWVMKDLRKKTGVRFIIPDFVEEEVVKRPLHMNRFRLEGFRVHYRILDGTFEVIHDEKARDHAMSVISAINNTFSAKGKAIQLIHKGEAEVLTLAKKIGAKFVGIDEKTTRILIENPMEIKKWLERKLHTDISVNKKNLDKFTNEFKHLKVLRSCDIIAYAYKNGYFSHMLKRGLKGKTLIQGLLWALKFKGCAIMEKEINQYIGRLK